MFSDIGALEVVTIVVIAVIVFGPEKLPKVIQDVSRFIRKVREFSESAKQDIRSELGPEFKDFEFEDLNPKTFVRKQLMENDDLGLKEIRSSFDLRKEVTDVVDAVNGHESGTAVSDAPVSMTKSLGAQAAGGAATTAAAATPDLLKKAEKPVQPERPPFDADAT
ncbi:sec-independent translocase [Streptomyces corynorhini]|uniref:Sec-independent protein translocase protein TatB n=1 Tax=Streptomyces corynorhini TaxID=2282652 RepID=A0A370B1U7_9ACTN|nr:sec-independent translocase [Streptomyces corynorhini]RDG35847.1 Sec-independent protein translocase TatB [Streptomyces corynorhini]